ncbi:MAG: dipeptide ABC transporter ATP-binding protein, partial [Pseudolabrys sp.]|nr:dipeptide ABC transporter ATP-binding protein [Pseudolabrys sp.]
ALVTAKDLVRVYRSKSNPFAPPQELRAVGGISFSIESGRTLAVVGESGCGKSTLARMVTLIEKPDGGTLYLDGVDAVDTPAAEKKRLRRTVQLVFQNPYGSLNPRKTIGAILEDPLIVNMDLPKSQRRLRVAEMLERVGLGAEHARRYPHMFSGGQRQRIAIARALMLQPKLLVADEPVSALDVSVQAQVLNLLLDLQEKFRLAYMFISHDLAVVRYVAHDVLVMYLGLAVEHGARDMIFGKPLHPYTQVLLALTPSLGGAAQRRQKVKGEVPSPLDVPKGCVFSTRCPYVTDLCRKERPPLRPVSARLVACHYAEQFVNGGMGSHAVAVAATP